MPTIERSIASYWNGSAWVDIFVDGTTSSAIISFDLEETVASPTLAVMRISNRSADPGNANAASAKGPFTGVLTDFMPIKVRDGDSQRVMFYGIVYSVKEVYDNSYGMVIEVQCRDYLTELRDNTTDGAYGYKIDTSVSVSSSLTNATARDQEKKLWDVGISSRGGLIKSFISHFTKNLTTAGDSNRFIESVADFEADEVYR